MSNYITSLMATAPEMLKNVSGIDMEQLVKRLTQKNGDSAVLKKGPYKGPFSYTSNYKARYFIASVVTSMKVGKKKPGRNPEV